MAEEKDWSSLLESADKSQSSDSDKPLSDGEKLLALFAGDDSDNPLQIPSIPDNHTSASLTSPDGVAYLAEDIGVSADKNPLVESQSDTCQDDSEELGWVSYDPGTFHIHENLFSEEHTGSQPEFTSWDEEVARFEGKTLEVSDPIPVPDSEDISDYGEATSLMSGGRGNNDVIIPILPTAVPASDAEQQPDAPGRPSIEDISIPLPSLSLPTIDKAPEPAQSADTTKDNDTTEAQSDTKTAPAAPIRPSAGIFTHSTSRDIPIPEPYRPARETELSASDEETDKTTDVDANGRDLSPNETAEQTPTEEPTSIEPDDADESAEQPDDSQAPVTPPHLEDYFAFRDLSHLTKVVTLACIVPILVAWSLLAYSLYVGRETALEQSYSETLSQAEVYREHAERNLSLADEFTSYIKRSYEQGELHSYKLFEDKTKWRALPYTIYITDANDRLITGRYPGSSEQFAGLYADHFAVNRAVDSDNLYISRSLWDDWSKSWVFSASRRLNAPDGSYAGSIIFTISPNQFFDYYQQSDHAVDAQRIFLLGRDLVIRATRTGSQDFIDSLLHNPQVSANLKSGTSGSFIAPADTDQEPYIYSYAALTRYPLIVVTGRSKAVALADINRRAINYVALALVCMVSGFVLWRLLLKLIARQYDTEKNLRIVQAELRQSVEMRTAELVAANSTLTETNNSLATLNRDLGDEIDRRRLAEDARRMAAEKLEYIAYHDTLTELPNDAYLADWLRKEIANNSQGIIGRIYINNLDEINDAFGYDIGNQLIHLVAGELVREAISHSGSVIAHLGEGRFCFVVPGAATPEKVAELADTVQTALNRITEVQSILIHVSATMGFVLYPEHGTDPTELLQNADNAIVAARTDSQNGWCLYDEQMKEVLRDRMTLTAQLRQAINNGEFLLLYQPKLSVVTGKVKSFEALIRWHSPVLGMVRPDRFIPLAEQNGLIGPIDEWVMREGCRFAKRLHDSGWSNVTVAINVGGGQFAAEDFLDGVRNTIAEIGIPNQAIEIEITETAVISSLEQAIEKISQLRESGIRIALDDFGVRYSTLSYLLRLPFDTLKVDKSFVDNIGVTNHGTDIVRMIIELAHLLGKEVVAEGVESRDQYDILSKLHCDIIQGYYFSKPLNETNALEYLRREERWSM